jgi:hypothetical protein
MRSNVAPFLWFVVAFVFAVVWRRQDQSVYLALAVVFAILGARSYAATKKQRPRPPQPTARP